MPPRPRSTRPWPMAGPTWISPPSTTSSPEEAHDVLAGYLPLGGRDQARGQAGRQGGRACAARATEVLAGLTLDGQPAVADAELLAPVAARKVLCAGVNYRRHLAEMGGTAPGDSWTPYFFLKPPSTA